jgi:LPS-assembly protein
MRRLLFISAVASGCLLAEERVELIGMQVDANGSKAHSSGQPIMMYQDKIMNADELFYDQNTSIVEARGNVNLFQAGQYHAISNYTKLNLETDTRHSEPLYMFDQNSSAWMSTTESDSCANVIDLKSGAVSGCNSVDPLWKIRFSSANYDTDKQWVNLFNARLYIKDAPVFYLPYFGYPTDTTRRSGLLMPTLGFSSGEGFYYLQPIYIAPQNWWDLELRPQIRTSRGTGMYGDFRFVDSPYSKGSVKIGYFKEQSDYVAKHDLAFNKHYGYNIDYRNSAFLNEWFGLNLKGQSGLYVSGGGMSDVDYLNLQHTDQMYNIMANQVLSRVNSYYSDEDNYFGAYVKYYQYLNLASNRQTIQTLPTLQYHRYLENFLGDHLLVNGDMSVSNFYRPDGKRAVQSDFNVPLTLQTSLFDDYIDASYTANSSLRMIGFYGNERTDEVGSTYEKGMYAQLDHIFKLSSTLVHPYETVTHVITPEVSYSNAGSRLYSGYYKTYHGSCVAGSTNPACDFYSLNEPSDTLALALNNYLIKDGKQIVADRLSQNFRHDQQGNSYGELQNELEWQVSSAVSYYNQTAFNHDRNRVTKEQNTVRYNGGVVTANLGHYYTDVLFNNAPVYTSYWTADATYQYNPNLKFSTLVAYDYKADLVKWAQVGFLYSTRCLDFGLKYVQTILPVVTNANLNGSISDSYIYVTIILKPLGGSAFINKLTNN